jgi:hypothetical protein
LVPPSGEGHQRPPAPRAGERPGLDPGSLQRARRLPAVVVASEPMDEDARWRALESGELLHVDGELKATVTGALDEPPAHELTLADLIGKAATSQAATPAA